MPEQRALADVEALLVDAFEGDEHLAPLIGGPGDAARVSTELPAAFGPEARVRLFRVGGTQPDPETGHLDRALVQLDAYGATKGEAWAVAAESLAAARRARQAHPGAVVTAVERVSGPLWQPDPPTGVPRYVTTIAVTVHPTA